MASDDTSTGPGGNAGADIAAPGDIPELSSAQKMALTALLEGKSAVDAAAAASVHRATIYRWQHFDPTFTAALNSCRRQSREEFAARLLVMQEKALSAISQLLDKQDFRMVKLFVSFLEKQRIGPGTPAGVKRRLVRPHQQAADAALAQLQKGNQMPCSISDRLEDVYHWEIAQRKSIE